MMIKVLLNKVGEYLMTFMMKNILWILCLFHLLESFSESGNEIVILGLLLLALYMQSSMIAIRGLVEHLEEDRG